MAFADAWTQFAARRSKAPLAFAHGMRVAVQTGVCCAVHSHREIEIVYHASGRGFSRVKGRPDLTFEERGIVVYAPEEPHDQVMEKPGEDYCVQIAVPAAEKKDLRAGFYLPVVEDLALLEEIRVLTRGRVRAGRAEQLVLDLRATATLCALIHLASTHSSSAGLDRDERYVQGAEQFIREHFASIGSLRDVAGQIGIGYDHLRHLYKARRGQSLISYVTEVRMERARMLLVHSRLPLKQVAAMCGFRDEYYFSAVFRRATRMPPGRYRAQAKAA